MNQAPIFHNFDKAPTHVAPFSHAVEVDGWIQLIGQMPHDNAVDWGICDPGSDQYRVCAAPFVGLARSGPPPAATLSAGTICT